MKKPEETESKMLRFSLGVMEMDLVRKENSRETAQVGQIEVVWTCAEEGQRRCW